MKKYRFTSFTVEPHNEEFQADLKKLGVAADYVAGSPQGFPEYEYSSESRENLTLLLATWFGGDDGLLESIEEFDASLPEFLEFEIYERDDARGREYGREYEVLALVHPLGEHDSQESYWHMAVTKDRDAARLILEALEAKHLKAAPALEALTKELNAWQEANHLPHDSADDQLRLADLTAEQERYLVDFCKRWDVAQKARIPKGEDNDQR